MISYDESLKILNECARDYGSLFPEEIGIEEAVGRISAEDLRARENNPPFDNSAMDGFAVNTAAVSSHMNLSDLWITVQTSIAAGDGAISNDCWDGAVEIMTGAAIPDLYFDSVVRVEDVEMRIDSIGKKQIRLRSKPVLGDNIRRAGEDTRITDVLLSKGTIISNQHLLVLATQGISRLKVLKKINVGILSTGKEIVDYKIKELQYGQIRNSTGVYLESVLDDPLFNVKNHGVIHDNHSQYIDIVKKIFEDDVDLLISTGAVSMGAYDFVKPSLESLGAKIHFHKCAIRPGKPILFASIRYKSKTRFIFGVPGNPVSTLVGLRFFIRPFVDFLLNRKPEESRKALLVADTKKPEGLKCFFKGKINFDGVTATVESLKGQASFMVSPLLHTNGWVVLPEGGSIIKCGTPVEVFSL